MSILLAFGDDDNEPEETVVTSPVISELARRMAEFDAKMQDFQARVQPAKEAAEQSRKAYDDMRVKFAHELQVANQTANTLAIEARNLEQELRNMRYARDNLSRELQEEMDRLLARKRMLEQDAKWQRYLDELKPLWAEKVRPYQMDGVRFMAGARDRGLTGVINADQMGLGKTLQALATVDLIQEEHKVFCSDHTPEHDAVLYVVPASVRLTTMHELRKWNHERPVGTLDGNPVQRSEMVKLAHRYGMTLVVNYEQLRSTPELLWQNFRVNRDGDCVSAADPTKAPEERHWSIVVLDEANKFKNSESQLFRLVETLVSHSDMCYPMTGTPIENRPEELWAMLHMVTLNETLPDGTKARFGGKFARLSRFIDEYCYQYGRDTIFSSYALDGLLKSVKDLMIRRTKLEVLADLPPKTGGVTRWSEDEDELVHYLNFDEHPQQGELYKQMRERFYIWLDEQKTDAIQASVMIAQFTRLRQIALYPAGVKAVGVDEHGDVTEKRIECTESVKFDACLDLLDELGVADGEKVLIYCSYEENVIDPLIQRIKERFPTFKLAGTEIDCDLNVGRITGKESPQQKMVTQDRFNNPDDTMRIVVGTTRAMGIGLNLQQSCSVGIFLDLDWNPGKIEQAEDRLHRSGQQNSVQIHTFHVENTIDGYIKKKVMGKIDMASGIVNRKELRQAMDEGLI